MLLPAFVDGFSALKPVVTVVFVAVVVVLVVAVVVTVLTAFAAAVGIVLVVFVVALVPVAAVVIVNGATEFIITNDCKERETSNITNKCRCVKFNDIAIKVIWHSPQKR